MMSISMPKWAFVQSFRNSRIVKYVLNAFQAVRASIGDLVELGVGIAVSLFVIAYLIPPALTAIYSANTTGWNSSVVTIFEVLLPILAILAVALVYFKYVKEGE